MIGTTYIFQLKGLAVSFLIALVFSGLAPRVDAVAYYSDPVAGSMDNDGSESSPWGSLKSISDAGKTFVADDVLFLMNGAHGQSYITGTHSGYVTIRAYPGHTPKLSTILLDNASYWIFSDLIFTADGSGGPTTRNYMMSATDNTSYIIIENCSFYSAESSASWSKADWYANAVDGLILRGDHMVVNSNSIVNTYHALQFEGDYVEAKGNLIDNFAADALRALGSHAVYENNIIRDAYIEDYNINHDDGIQLYDRDNVAGGVIDDVVIRNNIIFSFADPITPAMLADGLVGYSMQGIITTDGHAENMVVENNLVVSDHYHGITLAGALNCRVQNNTVIKTPFSANPNTNALPWVQINVSKRGIQPANSIIRNNIASSLTPWTYEDGTDMQVENNLNPGAGEYSDYFENYSGFDFQLKSGSSAINSGTNADLTVSDLSGQPRLVGPLVDCGAFEFQLDDDVVPPTIILAKDTYFNNAVVVVFSESVSSSSAEDLDHYAINGGIDVLGASLAEDLRSVTLMISELLGGISYTVAATGVADYTGNASDHETAVFSYLCDAIQASAYQDDQYGTNPPENAFDGSFLTKWAAEGSEWIQKSFCRNLDIKSVDIAFGFGDQRTYSFSIEVSSDGHTFIPVFSGASSGNSTASENFDFEDISAKYIKFLGEGNNVNEWNNYVEIVIHTFDAAPFEYAEWIGGYPLVGSATNLTDDPDNDRLSNLYEWSLGGDPGDGEDRGHVPYIAISGTNSLEYVYAKRRNAGELGLTYHLEETGNLIEPEWFGAWIEKVEIGVLNDEFNLVTNRISTATDNSNFFRLIIESRFY